jgi:hypothetical protein
MRNKPSFIILLFMIGTLLTGLTVPQIQNGQASIDNQSESDTEGISLDEFVANNTSVANTTSHFVAQVFIHKNFTGNSTVIDQNTPYIEGQFHDSISSLIISIDENNTSGYMVEVCEHESYAGNCMILGPGNHNVQTLGWLNDQISSIRALSPETLELKNITPEAIVNGS